MKKEKLNSETNKAIEWLTQQVKSKEWQDMLLWHKEEVFEQAKAMDKEQSEKMYFQFFKAGQEGMEEGGKGFDQYYNENFRIR